MDYCWQSCACKTANQYSLRLDMGFFIGPLRLYKVGYT